MPIHNPTCWQNHMGPWAMEEQYFLQALGLIRAGTWQPAVQMARFPRVILRASRVSRETTAPGAAARTFQPEGAPLIDVTLERRAPLNPGAPIAPVVAWDDDDEEDDYGRRDDGIATRYLVLDGGIAVVDVLGPIMKVRSKFGGCSSIGIARAVQTAVGDPAVTSIMLHIESPGGTAAGTPELVDAVLAADRVKPVHAFIEDCGASAAYWVASAARRISANAGAQVGSIGAVLVLEDTSKMADMNGVKVHVIATGPDKGVGIPGSPISDAQLKPFQEWVAYCGGMFMDSIAKNRALREKRLAAVTTGRMWPAPTALELGLLDAVEPWAAALKACGAEGAAAAKAAKAAGRAPRASAAASARVRALRLWAGSGPAPTS